MRIVIVEDEIEMRKVMGKVIETETDNIVLREADDGE